MQFREPKQLVLWDGAILNFDFDGQQLLNDEGWYFRIGPKGQTIVYNAHGNVAMSGTWTTVLDGMRPGKTPAESICQMLSSETFKQADLEFIYRHLYARGCRINR